MAGLLKKLGIVPVGRESLDIEPILPGTRYHDGWVQRHIFSLHGNGFNDSHRICGDFLCVELPTARLAKSEWHLEDRLVEHYAELAKSGSAFPAVVLDFHGSFIDGGHRHAAALAAGTPTILALIQINNLKDTPYGDDDD